MNSQQDAYQKMDAAWDAGENAYALELSRELLQQFPDFAMARLLQGGILCQLARYDEAERVIHDAIQGIPLEQLHIGYCRLGQMFDRRGDFENAVKWYRKAATDAPDKSHYHIFLGGMLAKKGDLAGAEASH